MPTRVSTSFSSLQLFTMPLAICRLSVRHTDVRQSVFQSLCPHPYPCLLTSRGRGSSAARPHMALFAYEPLASMVNFPAIHTIWRSRRCYEMILVEHCLLMASSFIGCSGGCIACNLEHHYQALSKNFDLVAISRYMSISNLHPSSAPSTTLTRVPIVLLTWNFASFTVPSTESAGY